MHPPLAVYRLTATAFSASPLLSMLCPFLGVMLCFLTTDLAIEIDGENDDVIRWEDGACWSLESQCGVRGGGRVRWTME